jgi:hypothetical protein
MDTLHNISPIERKFRSLLVVAGIVIAIICSVVSVNAMNSTERAETTALESIETPALANANLVVKAASTIGHSVIVFTKD